MPQGIQKKSFSARAAHIRFQRRLQEKLDNEEDSDITRLTVADRREQIKEKISSKINKRQKPNP